jgi:hypothetical protein
MKSTAAFLAVLALASGVANAETVEWKTDLPAALESAREDGKPVLALFWAEW